MTPLKMKRIITEFKFKMQLTLEMNSSWRRMITKNKKEEFQLRKNKKAKRMKRTTKWANKLQSKTIKSKTHEDTLNNCHWPQITKISKAVTKVTVALWPSISKGKEFQIPKEVEEQTSFHTVGQSKEFRRVPQTYRCMSVPLRQISFMRPTSQQTGLNQ